MGLHLAPEEPKGKALEMGRTEGKHPEHQVRGRKSPSGVKEGGNGRTAALCGNTAVKLVLSVHWSHSLHILTLVVAL